MRKVPKYPISQNWLYVCLITTIWLLSLEYAHGQQTVSAEGPTFVKAGEDLHLTIKITPPTNFEGGALQLFFKSPDGGINTGVELKPGETSVPFSMHLNVATKSGRWTLERVAFVSAGEFEFFKDFVPISFEVIGNVGLIHPTGAAAAVNPSQAQLLRTEAIKLQARVSDLKGRLREQQQAQTKELTQTLAREVQSALVALQKTQDAYLQIGSKGNDKQADAFFGDIRTSYQEASGALVGQHKGHYLGASYETTPRDLKAGSVSGYPLLAQGVLRAFDQNQLAYITAADAKSLIFDLDVERSPSGAAISYRRRGDDYVLAPEKTRTIVKGLTYAIWQIKLEEPGYKTAILDYDPFVDSSKVLHVDLSK